MVNEEKRILSEQKRLESIKQRKYEALKQKSLINISINNLNQARKIKFDDSDHSEDEYEPPKKRFLFDDDNNSDEDELVIVDQKKSQKLLQLQQNNFSNDKRFRMDDQFLDENDSEPFDDESEDETSKELAIVNEVLGLSTRRNDPVKKKENAPKNMLRYDPTEEEHLKMEITEEPKAMTKAFPKRKKPRTEPAAAEPVKVAVSNEKFYKVSFDRLKESLATSESFSLLQTYGNPEIEENVNDNSHEQPVEGEQDLLISKWSKLALSQNNPFQFDSSESEDDDVCDNDENANLSNNYSQQWRFFYSTCDARLSRVKAILEKYQKIDEDFAQKRDKLNKIVKSRIRNKTSDNFAQRKVKNASKK